MLVACEVEESLTPCAALQQFEVLVHNALPRKSVQTISIPIQHKNLVIKPLSANANVRHQEVFDAVPVHAKQEGAPHSLVFSTELGPLEDARFLVSEKAATAKASKVISPLDSTKAEVDLENDLVRVKIDKNTGSIISILNKAKNIEVPVTSTVGYYQAYQDKKDQRSGAYIFRPDSKIVHPISKADDVTLLDLHVSSRSGSATRVAFRIGGWVSVEYRVNDGDEFVEIEWTVGSIPIEDDIGKEVILRFDTQSNIQSAKTLYTDSNAMEFVSRVRNHRDTWNLTLHDDQEFVAANYFPITVGAYIKDDKHQLNVVTDRAQGAASLEDGQIEVMVHRRLLADDGKGVGENLNETESFYSPATQNEHTRGLIVRGNFFLNVDSAAEGMRSIRSKMEKQFFTPLVALRKPVPASGDGKVPWLTSNEFPENVGLTTLQELSKDCVMVRLTHLYAVDEHATLSKPVKVDFAKLLTVKGSAISEVTELLLTGVAPLNSREREPYMTKWKTVEPEGATVEQSKPSFPLEGTEVELQAIEVRSFRVCFSKSGDEDAADAATMTDSLQDMKAESLLRVVEIEPAVVELEEVVEIEPAVAELEEEVVALE